jgi:Tfp pilus assembly protein PilX
MRRTEYIVLAVLLVLGLLAFPAFRDVALIERVAISICAGAGLL